MSKQATISSLVRVATRSEEDFQQSILTVFEENDYDRIAEFFDRLNIPRSVEGDKVNEPILSLEAATVSVSNFADEDKVNNGVQRYIERHEKKLRWHAQRPSMEGSRNVILIMRHGMMVTDMRLRRLRALLNSQDEYTVMEWNIARRLMNNAFSSFRKYMLQLGGPWIDGVVATLDHDELDAFLGNFFEHIDSTIRTLEEHRAAIEERRLELTVLPVGFDPVKPPNYFGGDLMGRGPWKQYWESLQQKSHHFREALG